MGKLKIKTDDRVVVISGKDKGKVGRVTRVDPKRERVYVEGMNIVKRHQKPMQSMDPQKSAGGVVEKEGPIHVSNVMLLDPTDNKPTRVGMRVSDDGARQRVAKRTGKTIE